MRISKGLKFYDRRLLAGQEPDDHQISDYPVGWYPIRYSEDLPRGQVVPVQVMSHQFALFRGADGQVGMIDSQCCHLGADLARCGKVLKNNLVCGFHDWQFQRDGRCVDIPHLQPAAIPQRARQVSLPIVEQAGYIWFWYGPDPVEEMVDLSRFDSEKFINLKGDVNVAHCNPLPVIEHASDANHFQLVHRTSGPLKNEIIRDDGHHFEMLLQPADDSKPLINHLHPGLALVEMLGAGGVAVMLQSSRKINRKTPFITILGTATPIRENRTSLMWRIAVRKIPGGALAAPANWVISRVLWLIAYRNVHFDLNVLRWMRHPEKSLWVKPDGTATREFRNFYRRRIIPGWRFEHRMREPQEVNGSGRSATTGNGVDPSSETARRVPTNTAADG